MRVYGGLMALGVAQRFLEPNHEVIHYLEEKLLLREQGHHMKDMLGVFMQSEL